MYTINSMNIGGLTKLSRYDLAKLNDIDFAIFRHAASRASNDTARSNEDAINEWHERFDSTMQRYLASEAGDGG
jgi:hypothetical protein